MATVKGPLFSLDASDTLAKTITFSKWKGRNYIRKTVKPRNPKSGLQTGMRSVFGMIAQAFKNSGATAQANWKSAAKKNNLTPLNAMIRVNQINARINKGIVKDPLLTSSGVEAAPTTVVATGQTRSVKLTWTDSAGANDYGTLIYMSTSSGFTPTVATLVKVVPHGTGTATIFRLVTGTTYYFILTGSDYAGVLGTAAAQTSAVAG